MIHSSSNRATPTGENITKLVRQHYKPAPKQVYSHEKVQCRTDITCQKGKPEDYWNTNFRRRQDNMHKGFYSSSIEPYKPIGGQLILDPCELVLSALPGTVDKKISRRRRGTVFEEQKIETNPSRKEKTDIEEDSFTSLDLLDTAPSAGYDDIKKLIKESKQRIVCVRAGKWYEDHVRAVEETSNAELEANKPEDTGMVLKSVSSICLPTQTGKSSKQAPSESESMKSRINSGEKVSIAEVIKTPPVRTDSAGSGRSTLKAPPVKKNKISLLQVSTGITSVLQRKERQFRDHLLFLKSIFNVLRALHNLKVRDIRSKVPLSREVVEKLQKEHFKEEDYSRGAYVSRGRGTQASAMQVEGDHGEGHHTGGRLSIFNTAKRANTIENATKSVFGRRKSRNATNIATTDRSSLETWEDLLNVQPEPYKEEKGAGNMCFQIGVITKFMRWYRKVEDASGEKIKRRASIIPQHGAIPSNLPGQIDKNQLSHLQEIHEKGLASDRSDKGERESNYAQPRPGSAVQITEKVKKLPIWQQVAQEKSTVFQDTTQTTPNPDTSVQRCRQNLNKLKRSVQKENTATLEKIVRERLANYRLKLSTLNPEECSPLFEEQKMRLQDVKGNVNKCHLENFDVQPSKWYEELKEKTVSIISSYPQPEIIDTLTKLQIYAHMDNKTLSYSKAKLCLLMMSLPAYDICQIYMQKALKFIFENIMLGQEAQFYEWLNHRKIPSMIISDSTSRSASPERDFTSPTKNK